MGITSAGIVLLGVFTLRGVVGFREDYLYFKKEKFSLRSYYRYLKNKKGKVIKNESYIRKNK